MTFKYNNVYINNTSVITGPYEARGPLASYFDKSYNDLYFNAKTWEQAEIKLMNDAVDLLLQKENKKINDYDLFIAGDLLNQLIVSNFVASKLSIPFIGLYNACATSCTSIITASNMIEAGQVNNVLLATSSHNMAAEKQYRNPTEYGGPKRKVSTFTTTAGCGLHLSNIKSNIKIEAATLGKVIDMNQKDVFHMGANMASSAIDTLLTHLNDLKRKPTHYDLILTGDLGIYGKKILIDYMKEEGYTDLKNYNDCGTMIYDFNSQKDVLAGGSGSACGPLVLYSYILKQMQEKKISKVLYIATGALMNPSTVNQKLSIPSIAHAVSLEVVK